MWGMIIGAVAILVGVGAIAGIREDTIEDCDSYSGIALVLCAVWVVGYNQVEVLGIVTALILALTIILGIGAAIFTVISLIFACTVIGVQTIKETIAERKLHGQNNNSC